MFPSKVTAQCFTLHQSLHYTQPFAGAADSSTVSLPRAIMVRYVERPWAHKNEQNCHMLHRMHDHLYIASTGQKKLAEEPHTQSAKLVLG